MDVFGAHIDLGPIIALVVSVVSTLLGLALNKVKGAAEASTQASKTQQAALRVAALATALAGRAWDALSPQIQAALADGSISPTERAEIEATVRRLIADFTSQDDLEALANALGLPLAGVVAKVASLLIGMFTSAHDPTNTATSALQYPVRGDAERAEIDASLARAG